MLPLVGGLIFVAFVTVALVADIAMLQMAHRSAASRADRLAEAGAAMIDEVQLREQGMVVLDPVAAEMRVREAVAIEGLDLHAVGIDASPARACVEVSHVVHPVALRAMTNEPIDVRVTACAEPAIG